MRDIRNTRRAYHRLGAVEILALALACPLFVPGLVRAQAIGGAVTDATGGVVPGVTVEARSPSIIEQVRSVVTDGAGQYLIVALEPGTYTVTYRLPGFSTLVRDGIILSTGFTASLDVQLSVGDIEETVTVSGASPIVDIQNVEQRQVMDREVIDSIPTGNWFQNYALLVPGMVMSTAYLSPVGQDAGGMAPMTLATVAIHGGATQDQQLEINGMEVGDSLTQGSTYGIFPDSNFEEISIDYAGNTAEVESGGVRVNMIPREGSNQLSGQFFTTFTFPELHANNVDQELKDRGLSTGTFVDEVWTINPLVGGPILTDRLWFMVAHTTAKAALLPADVFFAKDPAALIYEPDPTRPSLDDTLVHEQSVGLTWQASTKDKLKLYWTNSSTDKFAELQGRTLATIFVAPEAAIRGRFRTNAYQATWTRPQTNRLLFEAGVSHHPVKQGHLRTPAAQTTIPGVLEFSPVIASRNMSGWFSGATERKTPTHSNALRGAVSYVTGSHNLKLGVTGLWLGESTFSSSENDWTYLNTFGGFPIRVNFNTPAVGTNNSASFGVYAQEQWTRDRITVNAGLRYDNVRAGFPDQVAEASTWRPQAFFVNAETAVIWQDLQPRLGVAYDLFGTGRTALKFSANRYGQRDATDWGIALNPGQANTTQLRTWNDGLTGCIDGNCIPGDGFPQGDPLNPAANGELLSPNTNPAFGQPVITTFFDKDWSRGWGNRKSNWEISAGVQQELVSGASIDISYFRRAFINFDATDNRALGPDDFDTFTVFAPDDLRLPNSGAPITLRDLKPESIRTPDVITTSANAYGGESRTWQGIDITGDARLESLLFQGGISTGAFSTDNCEQLALLPENQADVPVEYCRNDQAWLTQVKFLASYTLPYDIQVAATLQNQPGPERIAQVTFPVSEITAALGRAPTDSSRSVNVLLPGTEYGERFTQFDLRLTKILALGGGTRLRVMFDLFNLFNANAVTREQAGYGDAWLQPQVIMPGRLGKFAFQFDF